MVSVYCAVSLIYALFRGKQALGQHEQPTAPIKEIIKGFPQSSMIHVASSDKVEYNGQSLHQNWAKTFAVSSEPSWDAKRSQNAVVPHQSSSSLSTDDLNTEVRVSSTKPFAAKPLDQVNEAAVHSFPTELHDIPLVDKSTNSRTQAITSSWDNNVSRLDPQSDKRFIRVSERFGRIRKRRPTDIHQVGPTRRRQNKRKAALNTNYQPPVQHSLLVSDAAVTMTPLSELEIKSDQQLQKSLYRTTMSTISYGLIKPTTTPISLLAGSQHSPIFPLHPHSAPLAHNMPTLTAPNLQPFAQPTVPPYSIAVAQNNGNTTDPQYEQLGCGFDLMTQTCKDVFGIGWCQQCHDFGNIFLHDCKCTSVTSLYVNAMNAFASAAAAANVNAALNANIANQTLIQQLPHQQPTARLASPQPFHSAPSAFAPTYLQLSADSVNSPPTPLLPSFHYNHQQPPVRGFAHVASPVAGANGPSHYYSLTPQQVASVQQSSNAY